MKKIFIFCLLVSLAFLKNPFTEDTCLSASTDPAETCHNTASGGSSSQCCVVSTKVLQLVDVKACVPSIKPTPDLDTFKDIIPKFEAVSKEVIGFTLYGKATNFSPIMGKVDTLVPETLFPININLDCADRDMNIELNKINEADKKALQSEDHCLYYTYKSFIDKTSNFECSNGVLTDTIKAEGFTCGYYQFKINVQGETAREFKTCFLYHDQIYEQLSRVDAIVKKLNDIVKAVTADEVSFTIDIYDKRGYQYLYDSKTQAFTVVATPNKSSFTSVSKFLLLLSLLLL